MNIKDAQKLVDEWIKEHGVRYFNELTNMAILSEEVGEVAKIIARKYGEQSLKETDNIDDLGDELSDVYKRQMLYLSTQKISRRTLQFFKKNL